MPASPTLEIRADGGRRWGFGHAGRCLALAEELGDAAVFRLDDPNIAAFVLHRGGRLASAEESPPVVLLDRVAATSLKQVRELRRAGRKVALLDDWGSGRREADLVIDPPTGTGWPPAGGRLLAGFEHVLLRGEIRQTRRAADPRGVLLVMGGSDPAGATDPVAKALGRSGLIVTAVLGPGYGRKPPKAVENLVRPDGFTEALSRCAVLVAAYGQVLLEACFLGIPAIAVVLRADQVSHARAFCEQGTALMVDASRSLPADEIVAATRRLVNDRDLYFGLASRGPELVDGRGAARIAAAVEALA